MCVCVWRDEVWREGTMTAFSYFQLPQQQQQQDVESAIKFLVFSFYGLYQFDTIAFVSQQAGGKGKEGGKQARDIRYHWARFTANFDKDKETKAEARVNTVANRYMCIYTYSIQT